MICGAVFLCAYPNIFLPLAQNNTHAFSDCGDLADKSVHPSFHQSLFALLCLSYFKTQTPRYDTLLVFVNLRTPTNLLIYSSSHLLIST